MRRQSGPRTRVRTVLIVEADETMRHAFASVFEDDGIETLSAASRIEAAEVLCEARGCISAVVLDVGLGEPGDGERLLAAIAELERPPATVLLSALRSRVQPLATEYGVPFLVKPFDLAVLHAAVLAALENNLRPRRRTA